MLLSHTHTHAFDSSNAALGSTEMNELNGLRTLKFIVSQGCDFFFLD